MKTTLLMAAVLVLAACGEKRADTPAADTTGAMAPAAAPVDTAAMTHDTSMMHSDTAMARDTTQK
jgi:hypothetical protein